MHINLFYVWDTQASQRATPTQESPYPPVYIPLTVITVANHEVEKVSGESTNKRGSPIKWSLAVCVDINCTSYIANTPVHITCEKFWSSRKLLVTQNKFFSQMWLVFYTCMCWIHDCGRPDLNSLFRCWLLGIASACFEFRTYIRSFMVSRVWV